MMKILILCTGNSCRSIMAEALINHLAAGRFTAVSAGSKPAGKVHPLALETLNQHGVTLNDAKSKSWDEFSDIPIDLVITVCDNAAGEVCPVFPGAPLKAHWSFPDPAAATGTPEEIGRVFENVFMQIKKSIETFLSIPFENLTAEQKVKELKKIGEQ